MKRLTHDPVTACQIGLKLFRLILNEAGRLIQLNFSNNMRKVANENNVKRLLDVKEPNEQEKITIKCECNKCHFRFFKKNQTQNG